VTTPPDNSSLYKSARGYQEVMAHYDTALQSMGLPYESRYVETRFGPTHTVVGGNEEGKPVALWHGLNANSATWAHWIPALAPTHGVYAIDTIGGMGKSAPSRPSKTGPAYGQWAVETLEALGLKRINVIGASHGGWLIGKLASVAPERIGSAVLMSSAGFMRVSMLQALRLIPRILFKSTAEVAREMLALVSPPDLPPDPFFLELFELMLRHFRGERGVPTFSDAEVEGLTAPTCLLMGQYEATFNPYEALERGLRLLPHVIIAEIVPGVGHSMVHKQPDWVTVRVISFLERYAV
jgi:pimeloyl-ACP methyl ester carboxylesterase